MKLKTMKKKTVKETAEGRAMTQLFKKIKPTKDSSADRLDEVKADVKELTSFLDRAVSFLVEFRERLELCERDMADVKDELSKMNGKEISPPPQAL